MAQPVSLCVFTKKFLHNVFCGFECKTEMAHFFFGSAHLSLEQLPVLFPQYQFAFLNQVHGSQLTEASLGGRAKADAHWTREKNLSLVIQTADCLPILIAEKSAVCAIHAGWRGLNQGVITAAKNWLLANTTGPLVAAIGPHILFDDFEVGQDIAFKLVGNDLSLQKPHDDPAKRYVDLTGLARRQLPSARLPPGALHSLAVSTLSSPDFHSFRRDPLRRGRNYSFVTLL